MLSTTIQYQPWDTKPLQISVTKTYCNTKVNTIKTSQRSPNWRKYRRKLAYIRNFPQAGLLSRIVTSSTPLQVSYPSLMSDRIWATFLLIRQEDRQEIMINADLNSRPKELPISLKKLKSIKSQEWENLAAKSRKARFLSMQHLGSINLAKVLISVIPPPKARNSVLHLSKWSSKTLKLKGNLTTI